MYGMYRAVSDLLASGDDPLPRADGVAHAAPVVRVLVVVLWFRSALVAPGGEPSSNDSLSRLRKI